MFMRGILLLIFRFLNLNCQSLFYITSAGITLSQNSIIMKTKLSLQFRLDIEVESTRKVKVKAHTRVVNGKTVKIRSHYRNI